MKPSTGCISRSVLFIQQLVAEPIVLHGFDLNHLAYYTDSCFRYYIKYVMFILDVFIRESKNQSIWLISSCFSTYQGSAG